MLIIRAVSYNGQPPAAPLASEFGEQGGVIGRAEGNALVLPDPDRYVSRAHARILWRDGRYAIRDLSNASPVHVNGKPLGNGNEAALADGDELRIGAYRLAVADQPAQRGADPIDATMRQVPVAVDTAPKDDPLDLFGQLRLEGGGLPEDFALSEVLPAPVKGSRAPLLPDDMGPGGGDINQLFDLSPGAGHDPFPDGHPLAAGGGMGPDAAPVDPLVAIGVMPAPKPVPASQRNDAPEIHSAFTPPLAVRVPAPADGANMVVSWSAVAGPVDGIKTMVVQSPMKKTRAGEAASGMPAAPAAPAPATPAAAPVSHGVPGANAELLRAFLEGAGVPDLDMKGELTPQMMGAMGQLLREATQGTLDLLLSRAVVKREVHAEMTMIVTRENNPLKFSPNVEVALAHLLAPRGQGFMPPLAAMRDAYDDLRAHQFGFMAGMRAALAHVLRRFDPAELEGRLTGKSFVDTILPANRKAKLWGVYADMYADITREAEDDFHAWFGKAFLKAYEAQLDKLDKVDRADKANKANNADHADKADKINQAERAAAGGNDAAP